MKKAELEFIVFGEKDVIATSGPFNAQPMAVQIGAIATWNLTAETADKLLNKNGASNGLFDDQRAAGWWDDQRVKWLVYLADENLLQADSNSSTTKPTDKDYFYVEEGYASLIGEWLNAQRVQ